MNLHFGILNSSIEWANVHTLRVQTPNSSSLVLSVTFLQGFVKRKESFEVDSCFLYNCSCSSLPIVSTAETIFLSWSFEIFVPRTGNSRRLIIFLVMVFEAILIIIIVHKYFFQFITVRDTSCNSIVKVQVKINQVNFDLLGMNQSSRTDDADGSPLLRDLDPSMKIFHRGVQVHRNQRQQEPKATGTKASEPSISLFLKASETGIRTKEISKPVCYVLRVTCYVCYMCVTCVLHVCYMCVTCVLHVLCVTCIGIGTIYL